METLIKTYRNADEAAQDSESMTVQGWRVQSTAGAGTRFAPVHGLEKSVGKGCLWSLFGLPFLFGLFGRNQWRRATPITVVWVREPGTRPLQYTLMKWSGTDIVRLLNALIRSHIQYGWDSSNRLLTVQTSFAPLVNGAIAELSTPARSRSGE